MFKFNDVKQVLGVGCFTLIRPSVMICKTIWVIIITIIIQGFLFMGYWYRILNIVPFYVMHIHLFHEKHKNYVE